MKYWDRPLLALGATFIVAAIALLIFAISAGAPHHAWSRIGPAIFQLFGMGVVIVWGAWVFRGRP